MKKQIILLGLLSLVSSFAWAQSKSPVSDNSDTTASKPPSTIKAPGKIRPYKDVITAKAITKRGLLTIHIVDGRYYFEIKDSLLNKEILAVMRASKVPSGAQKYGGEIVQQNTIYFEKGQDNRVFIKLDRLISAADSTNTIYQAVKNSQYDPIIAGFNIVAFGHNSSVIDVTDFLKSDNPLISLPAKGSASTISKATFSATGLSTDLSFVKSVNSYPMNTELRVVKTYNTSALLLGTVSVELNTSLLMLPSHPMRQRLFDKRVGYFAEQYDSYSDAQQRLNQKAFIVRWNLEPKPEDMEKYKRGELVEPIKPIVYYIDPATPKKWRPYLIAGINDWQKAFEKAGFKNAIIGKEWPEKDTTMSMEDARYSVLRYFAANVENAYGPNVHDPRSGEILESHIGWYHNVMTLIHDWYMIQCGAVDTGARKMVFDDELMGQLIRFVSSHEIGHTLGLRHNMGASYATPVDSLRSKKWVEKYGHTSSIMDYARFNYVAQPEDHISRKGLFPRINDYDEWAIEWGYKYTGVDNAEKDQEINSKWIIERTTGNPRLWFGGEGRNNDPRAQAEDLGDDATKAGYYGILNLKRIIKRLPAWTKDDVRGYDDLSEMYKQLCTQYFRYIEHVTANVGGVYETFGNAQLSKDVYTMVPKQTSRNAILFLNSELFDTPKWLIDSAILNKTDSPNPTGGFIFTAQLNALNYLIGSNFAINKLRASSARFGEANTYTAEEMLDDLEANIFKELKTHIISDRARRNLEDLFIYDLSGLINPIWQSVQDQPGYFMLDNSSRLSDLGAIVIAKLNVIDGRIKKELPFVKDKISKEHWTALRIRIKAALEGKKYP